MTFLTFPNCCTLETPRRREGPSVIDRKHDPLGVVQKLLDSAESCTFSTTPEERGPLLSTCLVLAVKSGRLSLLIQVVSVLFSEQGNDQKDKGLDLLEDIRVYLQDTQHALVSHIVRRRLHSSTVSKINEGISEGNRNRAIAENAASFLSSSLAKRIDKGGIVMSFGKADHGKLGHGDNQLHRLVPTVVETLQDIPIVSGFDEHVCACN